MNTWIRWEVSRLSVWFATHHELAKLGFYFERNNNYATVALGRNGVRCSWEICWLKRSIQ